MTLSEDRIAVLLQPYLLAAEPSPEIYSKLTVYLDLLLRWNARTNLTSIRNPEEIVRRHFGESLFAGSCLAPLLPDSATMLDFGSGAGFPGIPIQLLLPNLQVTLVESQGKKATFLREVTRVLELKTGIWSRRAADMPAERKFSAVTLRAVDKMEEAISEGASRVLAGGLLMPLGSKMLFNGAPAAFSYLIPGTDDSFVRLYSCL